MTNLPPSPLLEQIRADQQRSTTLLAALARTYTMGHTDQPQLYKAFRALGWVNAFNVFLAAWRASLQYERLAHALDKLEKAGGLDAERLEALLAGRAAIVTLPPEEWPSEP